MTEPEACAFLSSLSADDRLRFYALLSHQLTVISRDTYDVQTLGLTHPARMRSINEIQHRLSSNIVAMFDNSPHVISDATIAHTFFDEREDLRLQQLLSWCFESAARRITT